MATKLVKADIDEWYRKLNVVRTQAGVGLGALPTPAIQLPTPTSGGTKTSTPVNQLVADIAASRASNWFIANSDNTAAGVTAGQRVDVNSRENIEKTMISLLRMCPNVNCRTVLHTQNYNTSFGQGGVTYFSNGAEGCGSNGNQSSFGGVCESSNCNSQGGTTFTNGWGFAWSTEYSATDGCSNSFWSGATYAVKNGYTEEQAQRR